MLNLFNIFWYEFGMLFLMFVLTLFTGVICFYILFEKGFAYEQKNEEEERQKSF